MPETFDLQQAFDDLTHDVSRVTRSGDVGGPIRRARRRRAVTGVVAVAVVAILGVTAVQIAGGDPGDSSPRYADTRSDAAPGAERRARLLALLPPGSTQVNVLDVSGFSGDIGLELDDPGDLELGGYLLSGLVQLSRAPFDGLLFRDLVTYAGTGGTDLFLIDRPAGEVAEAIAGAGWENDGGVLVPGDGVQSIDSLVAPYIEVLDQDGRALVAIAQDRGGLPDLSAAAAPEPGAAAARLIDLGGAVGLALDVGPASCQLLAVSVGSPTEATLLLGPPEGTAPGEVSVDDLTAPAGVTSIDAVASAGDLVRAEVTIEDPSGPLEVLRRLGLPDAAFC